MIAGDCVVSDPIFYEVNPDYKALKARADDVLPMGYTYVCRCPKNEHLRRQLLEVFPDVQFVKTCADLKALDVKAAFVTEPLLQRILLKTCQDVFYPEGLLERQVRQILACVSLAVSHESLEQHSFSIA